MLSFIKAATRSSSPGCSRQALRYIENSVSLSASAGGKNILTADPPPAEQLQQARQQVRSILGREALRPTRLIGVAGTVTTLATVELQLADYDSDAVNGMKLHRQQIQAQLDSFVGRPLQQRRQIVGLDPKRADVIIGGALIVDEILAHYSVEQLTVCDRGVRWGLAHELSRGLAG